MQYNRLTLGRQAKEALKGTVEEPSIHVQAGSAYFQ